MAADNGDPPVDLDDPLAVLRYGDDARDARLEARMPQALDHADAVALVARLEDLRGGLQAHGPRSARRGIGLIGRLLGHDVQAEAEAVGLRARMGTLVAAADRSAAALAARGELQRRLHDESTAAIANLGAAIARARDWLDANPGAGAAARQDPPGASAPRERLERRLQHLATVQAARELGLRQLALLQAQDLELLARWQRIRDVLLPAWRQHALGDAARAGSRRAGAAAAAHAALEAEVGAMAGTLDPQPASTQAPE